MGKLPSGEELTDEEMARRPGDWPAWPYLPVKKRDGSWTVGIVCEMPIVHMDFSASAIRGENGYIIPCVVFIGNMYDGTPILERERATYPTMAALFEEWRVD